MRICLLTTQDLDADPFPADDWPCDPRPYLPEATWHAENLTGTDTVARVEQLVDTQKFDVFFNLCDGAADEDRPGIEVVQTLERRGVPFTGSTSSFYEPTRAEMKAACARAGVATPAWAMIDDEDDVPEVARRLQFPMIVKHHSSYASVSLSRASRVVSEAGLRRQVRKILRRHGKALVEEFVAGIECTVLVVERANAPADPIVYWPVQYRFPPGETFKHARLKWVDFDGLSAEPVSDPALASRLRRDAARFFVELGGAGFGRCDVRVAPDGTAHMLEMNANCGVYYPEDAYGSADLCLASDAGGHEGFTRHLVEAALARHERMREVA